ncbi:MAG: lipoprotein-releasing ABC transporter permease subunit [Myxococcota bacterium]|nr:lipoprotein-releasing ABC transporter permease subunit [Myxococcota bacterium]
MAELTARIWEIAGATGGTLALAFIVALALGLAALAALFSGAAVVVLERFARRRRRLGPALLTWGLASLSVALVAVEANAPGLAEDTRALRHALPLAAAGASAAVGLTMGFVALALRWLAPRTLARLALGALALGIALTQGALGSQAAALFPAGVAALLALLAAVRGSGARAWLGPLAVAALLAAAPALGGLPFATRQVVAGVGGIALAAVAGSVLLGLAPLALAGFADARGSAEWFIAVRYLFAKRRQTFISVITAICVAGVAAGVWLIITVLSVMNGFERTWRDEIIGNRAHFTVQSGLGAFPDWRPVLDQVLAAPGVEAATPFLDAEAMVRGSGGEIVGVRVHGIDPDRVGDVTDLREDLVAGSIEALATLGGNGSEPGDPGIVIGSELAGALGLGIGDSLLLVSPFGGPPTPLGPGPRLSRFEVAGIFRSSFFQYDEIFTYVSLEAAQGFRRADDVVDGIEVRTADFYRSARIADDVQQVLGFPYYTRDWKEFFPAFFQALKTERIMMFVLLTMIMVVAAFAIVVTLVMMIMEKSGDIAILKAMGAEEPMIERIFAIEGALIGLVGTLIGVLAGVAVTMRLDWIQQQVEAITGIDALPASVYQGISELPAELDAVQIAVVVGIAMALALGGTWIPSRQGARVDPAEALRYE